LSPSCLVLFISTLHWYVPKLKPLIIKFLPQLRQKLITSNCGEVLKTLLPSVWEAVEKESNNRIWNTFFSNQSVNCYCECNRTVGHWWADRYMICVVWSDAIQFQCNVMGSLGITQVLCYSQLTDMNDTMCHTNCNEILLLLYYK